MVVMDLIGGAAARLHLLAVGGTQAAPLRTVLAGRSTRAAAQQPARVVGVLRLLRSSLHGCDASHPYGNLWADGEIPVGVRGVASSAESGWCSDGGVVGGAEHDGARTAVRRVVLGVRCSDGGVVGGAGRYGAQTAVWWEVLGVTVLRRRCGGRCWALRCSDGSVVGGAERDGARRAVWWAVLA
jgi:hypothetical protein